MEKNPLQLVSELGSNLLLRSRPNKDLLVKSLRQVATALSQIEQPRVPEDANKREALKTIESAITPLKKHIIKHDLLNHRDKDVRLLVTICVSEIFRIMAPKQLFENNYLRDIFNLFLSAFLELSDTASPYFSKRAKILETVSRCKCCVIMLDEGLHDLVYEMFNIFFSIARDHHQQSLINDVSSIMTDILKEEATSSLLEVTLQNLVEEKAGTSAARNLASSIIQSCTDIFEPFVSKFLASCFAEKDASQSNLKGLYHEIIFKIFQSAPQMLRAVIPNLAQELLTDQVDVRMKALNLTGKIFALPNHCYGEISQDLFAEFLKRFSDKSAEVRMAAISWGQKCYMANPSGIEASEVLAAIQERLLDFDDKVRTQALIVACDLMKFNMRYVPANLISEASERLRDKKIPVRKKALEKLTKVYQDYCNKCSEGYMTISDHFEQIPCKVLLLCCDRDCKEFRSQYVELVLSDDLFPSLLPVVERMRHWIHLFSVLNPLQLKSLNSILSQKRRLQNEMRQCLTLWKVEKDHNPEEMQRRRESSFLKMSASFPDPSKAEECFRKLDQMGDKSVFDSLAQLLDELTSSNAQIMREKFLKMIGDKHPLHEFLRMLSTKCSSNIFSSEHVQCALNQLCSSMAGNMHLKTSSIKLLLAILNTFPSYLRGSEGQFLKLLEENESDADELIEVLSKAAPHISVNFSDFYPILERMCLEGTRSQSKVAVSALASLTGPSEKFVFSELCEVLLDSLQRGWNIPTVLQSLGCVGQYSVSAFEHVYGDIRSYIYQDIFQVETSDVDAPCNQSSGYCNSCKLKIYGLKTLVKSFLPRLGQVTRKIDDLLNTLKQMLKLQGLCECRGASVRLAAAKAVLRLSRKWDLHLSPEIFRLTILMAKDSDASINRSFINKVHKLLKEQILPSRYACAFPFAISSSLKDLQDDSLRYMKEFIKDASREARIHCNSSSQGGSLTDCPAYVIVFLIHVLAHEADFPSEDCEDEHVYARFCCPLFSVLQALVGTSDVDCNMDLTKEVVIYLLCIFRAIKRAEDAVDTSKTPRLHILADIGVSAVNALNHNVITSPHAPRSILLPSSLYRIGLANVLDNQKTAKSHTRVALEKIFIEKIIHVLELGSQISMPSSTLSKHGQKCQQGGTSVALKNEKLPLVSCNVVETSITVATEANKKDARCSRKRARSALPRKCGTSIEQKNSLPKKSRAVREEEHVSSCSSLILRHSVESELPSEKLERHGTCLKDNVATSGADNVKSSKCSHPKSRVKSVLKDISNQGEAIVGQRIRLLSPSDGCLHLGTVEGFNSKSNSCKIAYDDGDVELVCLGSESRETLSQGLLEGKDTMGKETESFGSLNCIDENVHTRPTVTGQKPKTLVDKQSRKLPTGMFPPAANSLKGRKISGDTSASEVTYASENMGTRRTRRQKVS